jgi:hypothetical protein
MPFVVVRTRDAGVHVGSLESCTPMPGPAFDVVLRNARRLWSWGGANTLHEVALRGVSDESKISEPVSRIRLAAIEVIDATPEAHGNLSRSRW